MVFKKWIDCELVRQHTNTYSKQKKTFTDRARPHVYSSTFLVVFKPANPICQSCSSPLLMSVLVLTRLCNPASTRYLHGNGYSVPEAPRNILALFHMLGSAPLASSRSS